MRVSIAADHAGFALKEQLTRAVAAAGHAVTDLGTHSEDPVVYPEYAAAVGKSVVSGKAERGIIICGSGAGAAIAANKIRGVRCVLAHDTYTAHQAVEHDDRVTGILRRKNLVLTDITGTTDNESGFVHGNS